MKKNPNVDELIINIFQNNWKENFVFDAINDAVLTYEKFFTRVMLYSKKLNEFNLRSGDVVALIINNSLDLMILYFAGLLAEICVVPIDPHKGIDGINEIFSQIECKAVIVDACKCNFSVKRVISIDEFKKLSPDSMAKKDDLDIFHKLNYKKAYLITFTSGSTGMPKGVMHSFENLVKSALNFGNEFDFNNKNIFYHNLPMAYMAGILNLIMLPFVFESKIVIGDRFGISNLSNFWDKPVKYSVNTFWFNPTIISLLMKIDRGMKGVEYGENTPIIGCVGTAPLNCRLKKNFEKKYRISLYESYGLSELLFVSTESPNREQIKGNVGRKLDGVEISFAADGEILFNIEWMSLGYVNVSINDVLVNNKFLSGDLGYIDKNNFLHITGRKKDLIIKGGINISPKELEDFISNFSFFEESVIMGIEDEILGEKVVCFYVLDKTNYNEGNEKKINNEIIKRLGRDYKIDEFIILKEIPKNINGKVDKLKIKEVYSNNRKNDD